MGAAVPLAHERWHSIRQEKSMPDMITVLLGDHATRSHRRVPVLRETDASVRTNDLEGRSGRVSSVKARGRVTVSLGRHGCEKERKAQPICTSAET